MHFKECFQIYGCIFDFECMFKSFCLSFYKKFDYNLENFKFFHTNKSVSMV